jgi:cell wall-associated NlpC family hydrolase
MKSATASFRVFAFGAFYSVAAALAAEPVQEIPGADMPPAPADSAAIEDFATRDSIPEDLELWDEGARGQLMAAYARKYLGLPYRYGGAGPDTGFDCSGLTGYIYSNFGFALPRSANQQYGAETLKNTRRPMPGDLVFFKINLTRVSHVGIYIGDNLFIHAPRPGRNVEFADLRANYWKTRFAGARTFRKEPEPEVAGETSVDALLIEETPAPPILESSGPMPRSEATAPESPAR